MVSLWCLWFTSIYAAEDNNFTDPTKSIQVSLGSPTILLKLKSNPTTGYSWFLVDYNHDLLTPLKWKYMPPTSDLVGASGYELWTFQVNQKAFMVPQLTQITLQYTRPWVVPSTDRKLTFTVVVGGLASKPSENT